MNTRDRIRTIVAGTVAVVALFTVVSCNRPSPDIFAGKPVVPTKPFDYSRPGHPPFNPSFLHDPRKESAK